MSKASHTWLLRYGVATISVALGIWIRRLLDPALGEAYPFATLFFAVTLSAWYGGFGPALLAVVLGAVGSVYFLIAPHGSLALHGWDQQVGMALYLSVSFGIALLGGAMRAAQRRAEANSMTERTQRELLGVTLESIGDAVIVTDAESRVSLLNETAQALTGWRKAEAFGQPLEKVFPIFNEITGEAAESPFAKVRQTGTVIGLANHTVLLARDGKHYPIEDSGAPIKDDAGTMLGVVLVFRDMSERRRAEEAVRRQTARAEALVRTAARFNAQLDHDTIIKLICEETRNALAANAASVSLYDASHHHYYNAADVGLPSSYQELVQTVSRSRAERLIAHTAERFPARPQDRLLIRTDVLTDPDDPNYEVNLAFDIRSVISIAMTNEAEEVGRITAHFLHEPRHFSADEIALLQGLADQAAQAIRNARLFAGAQRRLQQLHAQNAIDRAIIETHELPATLAVVVKHVAEQLQVDAVSILLFDPETKVLSYAAGTGFRQEAIRQVHHRLGEGHVGRAAAERRIHRVVNLVETDVFLRSPLLLGEDFVSYYAVPLVAQEKLFGVFEIFHRATLETDPEWLAYLEALALQAAIAIEHTSLFNETRRAEHALRQANDELERRVQERTAELARQAVTLREQGELIELAHDAIIVREFSGNIISLNRGAEQMYGWTSAEVKGKPIYALLQTEFPQPLAEVEAELVRNGNWQGTLTHLRRAGSRIEVTSRWTLKTDSQGQPTRILEINTDITVQKQYERALHEKNLELEKASLAKDRFLASMSHELRTPLNAIIGFTGTLLMKLPGPLTADQERQLRTVQTSAQHLLSLINDLLDLAKIESGKLDLTLEPVALDRVVQEVATTLQPLADSKGLRLEVDVPKPNIVVRADQRAVTQIVLNLVNNAIKFTQAGSVRLAVDQQRDGERVRTEIRVVDTGPGILPEDQGRLFQAFSQVGSSLQYHQQGTGLGLHLSQLLAELMGARITVQSEYGQGSTFALSWSGEAADPVARADHQDQLDGTGH